MSTQTVGSLSADQKEVWRQLRKELESVGITPVLFEQHRTVIIASLQKAIREEGLAGDIPDTYDSCHSSDLGQEDLETSSTPGATSSTRPYVKDTDEPLQQPIQDRKRSDKVFNITIARRIKNILKSMGRMAGPSIKSRFMAAAECGNAFLVEQLLIEGATVDSRDSEGYTPLAWAAANGHEAVVKLLLNNGAAVESMDEFGRTPLARAAANGHEAVVELLLDNNAAVDSMDEWSRTPLSWAANNGREAVVKLLLSKGADVASQSLHGKTPLSWAAEYGKETVVKLLLNRGAAVDSTDKWGETPLSRAAVNKHKAVVKLLQRHAQQPYGVVLHSLLTPKTAMMVGEPNSISKLHTSSNPLL